MLPRFERMGLAEIDLAAVMEWIDVQRAAVELSEASIRHNMIATATRMGADARAKAFVAPFGMVLYQHGLYVIGVRLILEWGPHARPIAPDVLVEQVKTELDQQARAQYA